MNMSHDHFGNLRQTSRMTTEQYGKINTKRKSNRKSTEFVNFHGGTAGKGEDLEDRDGEKGPTCEHGENKDNGVWY